MRTALTALGMIIGVAAVIVMVAIGNGARHVDREPASRSAGTNIVTVSAGSAASARSRRAGRDDDAHGRRRGRDSPRGAGHPLHLARRSTPGRSRGRDRQLEHAGSGRRAPRLAADPLVAAAVRHVLHRAGRARAAKVAVLGSVARDQLFGAGDDPTGATIRIKNQPFR